MAYEVPTKCLRRSGFVSISLAFRARGEEEGPGAHSARPGKLPEPFHRLQNPGPGIAQWKPRPLGPGSIGWRLNRPRERERTVVACAVSFSAAVSINGAVAKPWHCIGMTPAPSCVIRAHLWTCFGCVHDLFLVTALLCRRGVLGMHRRTFCRRMLYAGHSADPKKREPTEVSSRLALGLALYPEALNAWATRK